MANSTRFLLPYLEAAQAQKHVTHNDALRKLDICLSATALDKDLATPPGSPATGDGYIVAASPTGLWAGKANYYTVYIDGAWQFVAPVKGFVVYVADENKDYIYDGSAWYSQPIFVDKATGNIGINAAPVAQQYARYTAANPGRMTDQIGSGEGFEEIVRKANGTPSALTTAILGDVLCDRWYRAHDGTAYRDMALERYSIISLTGGFCQGTLNWYMSNTSALNLAMQLSYLGDLALVIAGGGLKIKEGTNGKSGEATLVAGTVTVANTLITANSRIQLTTRVIGGTPGFHSYTLNPGVGFTINSSSGTDTSTDTYFIVEPS